MPYIICSEGGNGRTPVVVTVEGAEYFLDHKNIKNVGWVDASRAHEVTAHCSSCRLLSDEEFDVLLLEYILTGKHR